ncbi:MAG: Abi family protein [Bacteroidales bacterium]|nr:Abi family protein [Bacteroidales bacterium]
MVYDKQPLDYPQQIQLLKDRGMIISDDEFARKQLEFVSYFRLANYWRPMEADKIRHIFKPNSKFENAVRLYYFDKKLRNLLFAAVQSVEISLRTKAIHYISMKYGAFWFANKTLFVDENLFNTHLSHIRTEIGRSKEDFIEAYFEKYEEPDVPPVWQTLEVISLGTLSKLISNLSDKKIKKEMARSLGIPQHIYMESWIRAITILRNCIAHHARTWNRKFPCNPQMPEKLNGKWISKIDSSNQNLYPLLCVLAYLENVIHPDNNFVTLFKKLLDEYPNVDVAAMGFPKNWENEPLWR